MRDNSLILKLVMLWITVGLACLCGKYLRPKLPPKILKILQVIAFILCAAVMVATFYIVFFS